MMKAFNKELKAICRARKMTLSDLAKKARVSSNYFNMAGGKKGISYHQLEAIIGILKADFVEIDRLRHSAKFTTPRSPLKINYAFIEAVSLELYRKNLGWDDEREVCKAVLKFAGVKAKVTNN